VGSAHFFYSIIDIHYAVMTKAAGPDDQGALIQEISQLSEAILNSEGMELVDVTFRRESQGWVLRILIDKPSGVTINDCGSISYQVSDLLDVKNIIHYPYHLEVSSPGLNRPLKREADFKQFIGERIVLKTSCLIDNRKTFKGRLTGYQDGMVHMDVEGNAVTIPYAMIERAHIEFRFGTHGPR
jgi:ribosome maturation factor RimP